MTAIRAKIEQINNLLGNNLSLYDKAIITSLEDEIAALRHDIRGKRSVIETLSEKIELMESRLDVNSLANYANELKETIKTAKTKNKVLTQYVEHLGQEDFAPNKLRKELDEFNSQLYMSLKPTMDKSKALKVRLNQLNELEQECQGLREKTESMRPKQAE